MGILGEFHALQLLFETSLPKRISEETRENKLSFHVKLL